MSRGAASDDPLRPHSEATRLVETDAGTFAVAESGCVEGPTLVLLHGFPLTSAMWGAQLAGLGETARVVAPDLRGYGASPLGGWLAQGEAASIERYAADVVALLDGIECSRPRVVVGFSMGGYVALALERMKPDAYDALVLMDTRAIADDDAARATRLKMADHVDEWGAERVATLMRPKLFAEGTPEAIVEKTVAEISAADPAAIAAAQRAMAARPDSTELLPSIAKPTLVVVGEHDAISTAEEMRGVADAIPGAGYALIEGAGHMAPVELPDAVNAALSTFVGSL